MAIVIGKAGLRLAHVENVGNGCEVSEVVSEQDRVMGGGRGGDRKVRGASARLAPPGGDHRLKPTPFTCDPIVDREGIGKARLNRAEASSSDRPRLLVGRDQQPKVQLGDRYDTDCGLDVVGDGLLTNQDGGVKDGPQLLRPRVAQQDLEPQEILGKCRVGRQIPQV